MSTIKSSSEDLTLNADGSNEVKFQINAVEKASINSSGLFTSTTIDATALTGNLPAISGASLTGLPASGDKRNFILDGDMTQWPEGDRTGAAAWSYGPALFQYASSGNTDNLVVNLTESADVPTASESGHQSASSFYFDPSTAETAIAADEYVALRYVVSGSDFRHLHKQQVTLSFWVKSSVTGTFYVAFVNSGQDRSYPASYTISSANTWERKTITLTLDTSGTWLFTDASKGLAIKFALGTGSDFEGTANTWQAGHKLAASGSADVILNAADEFRITQVGLYLGATAPTFSSPPIATVKNQVDYYVERWDFTQTNGYIVLGRYQGTTKMRSTFQYRTPKRILAGVSGSGASTWEVRMSSGALVPSTVTFDHVTNFGFRGSLTTSAVTGDAVGTFADSGSGTAYILIDARH